MFKKTTTARPVSVCRGENTSVGHLSNSLPFHLQRLHLGEVVVVGHHIGDDGLLIRVVHTDVCTHTRKLKIRVYTI